MGLNLQPATRGIELTSHKHQNRTSVQVCIKALSLRNEMVFRPMFKERQPAGDQNLVMSPTSSVTPGQVRNQILAGFLFASINATELALHLAKPEMDASLQARNTKCQEAQVG